MEQFPCEKKYVRSPYKAKEHQSFFTLLAKIWCCMSVPHLVVCLSMVISTHVTMLQSPIYAAYLSYGSIKSFAVLGLDKHVHRRTTLVRHGSGHAQQYMT